MKKQFVFLIVLFTVLPVFGQSGREIMEMVENKGRGNSMHAALEMKIIEKNGDEKKRLIEN